MSQLTAPPLMPCPVFTLPGGPLARGQAHGESARALIAGMLAEHFAFLEFSGPYAAGISLDRESILRASDQYLAACRRFAPRVVEEMRGIAEGSGQSFREIFSLNTFIDIADMVRPATAANYTRGCTSFGARRPATQGKAPLIGQTFDTKAVFEPYVVALQLEGSSVQPPAVLAGFAGMVGCAGINAEGVAVVINHLHTHDARPGVPFTVAVRAMLCTHSAEAAIAALACSEPASAIHYLVADAHTLVAAETSATQFATLSPQAGLLAHANHCESAALRAIEVEPGHYSLWRGQRTAELLARSHGSLDPAAFAAIAQDHAGRDEPGRDDSVCSHVEPGAPRLRQYKTCFAVTLEPDARAMELYVGNPCEGRAARLVAASGKPNAATRRVRA